MEGYTKNSEIPEGIFYINLDQLFEKRVSQRESALSFNIGAFTENRQNHGFIEQNLITLLYRCLDSMTKGSAKEISLAAHTIGLMAVAVAHRAREVYVESLPVLSAALKSGSVSSKYILECLVLVTFFGAENCEDTQSAMQMIWEFIHKKSASTVLATAISAWAFLLASMDGWKLSYKHWQGATSYLSNLLKEEDEAVRLAAGEALALILEIGFLEKFSGHCSSIKSDEIINNVNKFILKFRAEYHESQDSSKQLDFICDVLKFFEDDYYPQVSVNIGGHILTLSTYSQLIQSVFDFTPEKHFHHEKIWDEATVMYFIPEARTKRTRQVSVCKFPLNHFTFFSPYHINLLGGSASSHVPFFIQRLFMSPNSAYNKARTQLLNKNRMLTKRGSIGHGDE
ncbi:hypothetical protein CK203_008081 [Vitis vinifera]|uniref:Interferon-related developmental regulator N-terminal domain-containing protein n=1 Tax=Vitis vinifera TaxID=29760 RepID=A0A438K1P1_VITVI|nr:hypothetical protein CK203_008081 [Vitis vinifera]